MNNVNFNPILIHALTNLPMEEISDSPSLSDLPGSLATLVAQNVDQVSRAFPKNEFVFVCKSCGKRGRYDVGHISINMEGLEKNGNDDIDKYTQTNGYFRCKHCNSAEKWGITQDYRMHLMVALLGLSAAMENPLISLAKNQLFDGSSHKYASDAESYLLEKILKDPGNSFLWNRLANLYYKGGRPDLAAVAFEHSLTIDPLQTESYYSLGMIMDDIDPEKAVDYYHRMLASAPYYTDMDALGLRELIAVSLHNLVQRISLTNDEIPLMPDRKIYDELGVEFQHPADDQQIVFEGELELDDLNTFYPLAEIFMGERRLDLPRRKATTSRKKK